MKSRILFALSVLFFIRTWAQTGAEISLPIKKAISERPNYRFMGEEEYYKLKPNEGLFLASSSPVSFSEQYSIGYYPNEVSGMVVEGLNKLRIRLDWFYTEEGQDVLTIYDGPSDKYPVLATFSGNGKEGHLTVSTQNKVFFKFTSNGSKELSGFRFRIDEANLIGGKVYQPNMPLANDPPSDNCQNAPVICNLGGYQGATDIYTPDNTNIPGFCGSIENNSWLAFIASDDTATIVFNSFNCNDPSSGIQALIYQSSDCNNFTKVSNCVSQSNGSGQFTITTNTPLIPGQKYYIMVDGYAGNVCQYSISGGAGVSTALTIAANPSVICPGGSVTLTASNVASSYSWVSNPPTTGLGNTQSITVTPSATTSYTVYTGPGQCATFGDSANTTVTVSNTLPPPTINVPNPVCAGSTLVLSTNSGASGATYTWTGPNGFTSNQSSPSIPNVDATNDGTYTLVISYGPSCSTQQGSANVTVDPGPNLTLTPSSAIVCAGDQVTLTGSGAPSNPFFGANPYIYDWNPQEASVQTENCVTIIFTICNPNALSIPGVPAGPKAIVTPNQSTQICVRSSTTSGCQGKACANIIVASPTSVVAGPDKTVCQGDSVLLTASNAASYSWTQNSNPVGTGDSIYVQATTPGTYTYTVTSPTCGGGSSTGNVVVTVNPAPTVTVTNSNPVFCSGGNTTLTASGANNYSWVPNVGLNTSVGTTVVASPNTSTVYTVYGNSGGVCNGVATTLVNVIRTPDIQVAEDTVTTCPNESILLNASGAAAYSWTANGNYAGSGSSIGVAPTVETLYTVVGINGGTCFDTATVLVKIAPNLTITVTPSVTSVCQGGTTGATLTASGGTVYYTWTPTNGLGSVTTGPQVTALPTTSTTYTVTASTKPNGAGCTGVGYATVNVVTPVTLTQPSPAPQKCAGSGPIDIQPGNLSSLPPGTTFSWSNNNTIVSTSGATATVNPSITTNYTLTANPGGCSSQIVIPVTVNALPFVDALSDKDTVCPGGAVNLLANTNSGSFTYSWLPSTVSNPNQQATSAVITNNPTKFVVWVTNTATGCMNKDSVFVYTDGVTAHFTASPNPVDMGQPVTFANTSINGVTYSWDFGDNAGTSTETSPTYTFAEDGTYTVFLQATNARGCVDTETVNIVVKEIFILEIPNVFTPNGDGKYDEFKMIKAKGIKEFKCEIYNRWGNRLYEFTDKNGMWDGSKHPDGVYYYIITYTDINDNQDKRTGHITIADSK